MIDGSSQAFPSGTRTILPPSYVGGPQESVFPTMGMTVKQYAAIHIAAALVAAGLRSGQDMSKLDEIAVEFTNKLLQRL